MQAPQMSMEEAIAKLRQRLEAEPDNAEGWFMLARTYAALGEYDKAVPAFKNVLDLVGEDDANLLLRYADALAMNQNRRLSGDALAYIEKAMAIDPHHPQALWMMGMAMEEKGDYERALENWYQVLPQLQDPQAQTEMQRMVGAVEPKVDAAVVEKLKQKYTVEAMAQNTGGAEIQVTVSLDDALKDKVSPDDTVFIFARAVSGPPMPLAAIKQPVSALPLTITLDESMAMMPTMKLSLFDQVTVGAKISSSGTAGPAAGDLFGEVSPVATSGGQQVSVVIDNVR
jgi:cytochrome c-type biogenesis protein CcmH